MPKPTAEKEIEIAKPVQTIVTKVKTEYKIASADDMTKASEWRVQLKAELKALTTHKETKTKPMNAALAAVRADYKPFETQLETALAIIDRAMSSYQTAETRRVQEEEAKIAARVGDGKGKLQAETAVRKMDEIEKPETKVAVTGGATAFRPHQQLKVTDMTKIPQQYFDLNESRLLLALKNGSVVPGAEIEIVQIPVNARR